MPTEDKISVTEFSKKIKEKYPDYKDIDDAELAKKMIEKYPEYANQVSFEDTLKKKVQEPTPLPSQLPSDAGTLPSTATPSALQEPTLTTKGGQPFLNMPSVTGAVQETTPTLQAATTPAEINTKDQQFFDPELQKTGLKLGDKTESLLRGTTRLVSSITKTPAFLYDVAVEQAKATNPFAKQVLDKAGIGSASQLGDKLGIENVVAKDLDEAIANSEKKLQEKYDKPVSEYLFGDKPDYEKGFGLLANRVIESFPTTAAILLGNAGGVTALESGLAGTAVFGAEKKGQLDKENPDMSSDKKVLNALVTGGLESVTENLPLKQLAGVAKKVFFENGIEAAKKIATEGYLKTYGKMITKYLGVTGSEVAGEVANQFGENVTDWLSGARPDIKLSEGLLDAGLVAIGSSGPMTASLGAIEVAKTKLAAKKATEIQDQKKILNEELASPEVSPEAKSVISDKLKTLNEEDADLYKKEKESFESLPVEKQKEVNALIDETKKLVDGVTDKTITEPVKEILTKDLEAKEKEIDKIFSEAETQKAEVEKQQKEAQKVDEDFLAAFNPPPKTEATTEAVQETVTEKTITDEKPKETQETEVLTEKVQETPEIAQTEKTTGDATKTGKITESNLAERKDGDETRQTAETGVSDSVIEGGQVEEKVIEQAPVEEAGVSEKPKKEKIKQELIDEEAQIEAQEKDDAGSVKRLNDDIVILKGFKEEGTATKKFKGLLERAFKMKEEGKISRPTYVKYRNMAQQILGPKVSVDSEQAQFKIETFKEEIKKKLLGEGYKKIAMSAPGFGPAQVAHLIDLTAAVAKKAVALGYTAKEAVQMALEHVKNHPNYKKLIEGGHLKEEEFGKTVTENFEKAGEDIKEPVKKTEPKKEAKDEKKEIPTGKKKEKDVKDEKKRKSVKSLSTNLFESENLNEKAKEIISEMGLDRDVHTHEEAKEQARNVIDKIGPVVALNLAKDRNVEMAGNVRTFLFGHILNDWNKAEEAAKTPEEKNRLADMQADLALDIEDVLMEFERSSTEAGRLIGAIGEFYKMSPLGVKKKLTKEIERFNANKKKKMKATTASFNNLKKDLGAIDKKAKKEKKSDTKVEDVKEPKKEGIAEIKKKRADILTKLKESFGSLGFAATPKNMAEKQYQQTILLGQLAKTYIDEGVINVKEFLKNIKKDLKEFGFKLTNEDVSKLMEEEVDGKKLSEHFEKNIESKEEKLKAIEKALKTKPKSLYGTKQKSKKDYEKLLDLYEKGATEGEFENAFYEKFGLLNPNKKEIKDNIESYSKKIANAPEGVLKNKEQTKYLNWLTEERTKSYMDAGMSYWYANILSSYETHLRNIQFNAITSAITMPALLAQKAFMKGNIKEGLGYFGDFFQSFGEAKTEAKAVLGGGMSRFEDVSPQSAVERSDNKFLKMFALPGRALRAEDAAFTAALYNAKQREIFNRIVEEKAKSDGKKLTTEEKEKLVSDLLGYLPERVEAAKEKSEADIEKVYGTDWKNNKQAVLYQKIRQNEIIEQSRPLEVRLEARDWAKKALLTNKPEGASGIISDVLTTLLNHIPILRAVTPFVNVPLNLMNQAIQRSPIGFVKVIRGKVWFDKEIKGKNYGRELTPDERKELLIKATNYTIAMAATALAVAAAGGFGDDDDKAKLIVTGKEGDFFRNQAIQKGGGLEPYSIYIGGKDGLRIGYQNTPLESFLSPIGYFRDFIKYEDKDEKTVTNGIFHSFFQYINGTLDKASMKGMKEILKYADPEEVKRMSDEGWSTEVAKKINTLFPYSGLVKATTADVKGLMAADDNKAIGFVDHLTNGLPFDYYQTEKIDVFGRPIKEKFNIPLLPIPSKKNLTQDAKAGLPKINEKVDKYYKAFNDHNYDASTKFVKDRKGYSQEKGEFVMSKKELHELNVLRGQIAFNLINQENEEGESVWSEIKKLDNETFASEMDKIFKKALKMAKTQKFVLDELPEGELPEDKSIEEIYDEYDDKLIRKKTPKEED